jgi:hypothetical protein
MKSSYWKTRFLFKFILSLLLLLASFGALTYFSSKAHAETKYSEKKETVVYITRTGKKYHRSWCRSLKKSRYEIIKSEAIRLGYTPCKICRP